MARRRGAPRGAAPRYPRTARLNELFRQILADEVERIDDDRVELLTITGVDVESDLRHARVFFDCLDGEDGDAEASEALAEHRVRLQAAIGSQARVKRVPELRFEPDPAIRSGERIDAILRSNERPASAGDDAPAADGD
jgi:ribosome-binding factor A